MSETAIQPVADGEIAKPNGSAAAVPSSRIGSHGVILTSFDDLARFSKMVAASGFAPKGMERFEAIGAAIQMGLELGLSPLQALQSTAVINGRPAIYGDAAKALVETSGHMEDYDQWYELSGKRLTTAAGHARTPTVAELKDDGLTCCVLSKRRGRKALVTTFSVGDARNAGLWGKSGPWTQYPARMLLFRARGFNLRDNFGDVLKGLRTVEEVQDIPLDVTPTAPIPAATLASKLQDRAKSLEATPEVDDATAEPDESATAPDITNEAAEQEAAERTARAKQLLADIPLARRTWALQLQSHWKKIWTDMTPDEQEQELARMAGMVQPA